MALTKVGKEGVVGLDNSADATAITIDSSERVLIGTTTEGEPDGDDLTIATTGNTGMTIRSGTSGTGSILFSDGTSGDDEFRGFIQYHHNGNHLRFATNAAEAMRINSNGSINKPLQPAFLVRPSSNISNVATDDVIAFGTEVFDRGANFASNAFTAPVEGLYNLTVSIRADNLDVSAQYSRIFMDTSNRNYFSIFDVGGLSADPNHWTLIVTVLADMDANDTVSIKWSQAGGASQADVDADSYFSGYLVA